MLEGEIALVTGASRGIGRAIALALGGAGAAVAGTATTEAGASDISEALKAGGCRGLGLVLNVTDQSSIDETLARVTGTLGAPTILVNNAGITRDNLLMRMKDAEWESIIDTNLGSVYRMSKACLRAATSAGICMSGSGRPGTLLVIPRCFGIPIGPKSSARE